MRGAIKWTRTEDKLDHAIQSLEKLVLDKDATHAAMIAQMKEDRTDMQAQLREDRTATNRRLEWLEHEMHGKR